MREKSLNHLFEHHLKDFFAGHKGELPSSGLYDRIMCEMEGSLLKETLKATGGNQLKAAEILGINRNTLRKKMQKAGLHPKPKNTRRTATKRR